jgi:hypothetical protein
MFCKAIGVLFVLGPDMSIFVKLSREPVLLYILPCRELADNLFLILQVEAGAICTRSKI